MNSFSLPRQIIWIIYFKTVEMWQLIKTDLWLIDTWLKKWGFCLKTVHNREKLEPGETQIKKKRSIYWVQAKSITSSGFHLSILHKLSSLIRLTLHLSSPFTFLYLISIITQGPGHQQSSVIRRMCPRCV